MSRADKLRAENEKRNLDYESKRAKLAKQIAQLCATNFKRKWKPPTEAGCVWLATALLAIHNRAKAWPETPEMKAAISSGHKFVSDLKKAGLTDYAERIAHTMPIVTNQGRDPVLFLAEQVKVVLAQTNGGASPASGSQDGPLVSVVAGLFDLAKVEPGEISKKTVANIVGGLRHGGAI